MISLQSLIYVETTIECITKKYVKMIRNAKQELLEAVGGKKILAANIYIEFIDSESYKSCTNIKYDSRTDSLEDFLNSLDHDYKNHYYSSCDGEVLLEDYSFLRRSFYEEDNWVRIVPPRTIDDVLKRG